MNKVLQLKIASMILFWFGITAQLLIVLVAGWEYYFEGKSDVLPLHDIHNVDDAMNIAYTGFAHFIHIVAGYWLSKGKKKGLTLGLFITIYEIVPFLVPAIYIPFLVPLLRGQLISELLVPSISHHLYTVDGFGIRVLFAFVIYLIVSARKELTSLQSENWRPWKNPKTSSKS